nr:unnamed protein product [Bacillus subtilis]
MTLFLHGTSRQNQHGHLEIGGVDALYLAEKYGTPLYVYDVALIRERAKSFKQAFISAGLKAQVAYASKAFSSVAMIQLAEEEGLSLDVVSGESYIRLLQQAFRQNASTFMETIRAGKNCGWRLSTASAALWWIISMKSSLLEDLCKETGHSIDVLLRITPGVEAHTHDYITTGQEDSKFGFDLHNGQTERAIEQVLQSEHIQLLGVHCHIGSQIFDTAGFVLAAEKIFKKLDEWRDSYSFVSKVLNLGGGFGIRYTEDDEPLHATEYVEKIIEAVKENASRYGFDIPEIWIEPGRSLVGDAGTTLYTVGSQKEVDKLYNRFIIRRAN